MAARVFRAAKGIPNPSVTTGSEGLKGAGGSLDLPEETEMGQPNEEMLLRYKAAVDAYCAPIGKEEAKVGTPVPDTRAPGCSRTATAPCCVVQLTGKALTDGRSKVTTCAQGIVAGAESAKTTPDLPPEPEHVETNV